MKCERVIVKHPEKQMSIINEVRTMRQTKRIDQNASTYPFFTFRHTTTEQKHRINDEQTM